MISMAQCDPHPINAQYISSRGRTPMANVVKKHTISSELAQKMVDQAMAKARQLGVAENVAILDEGGNLKAFGRMDGAPILSIEIAQNKSYTALFGVSTQDFFNFIPRDPSLLSGIPTLALAQPPGMAGCRPAFGGFLWDQQPDRHAASHPPTHSNLFTPPPT